MQQRPDRVLLWLCAGLSTGKNFLQVSSAGTSAALPRGGGVVHLQAYANDSRARVVAMCRNISCLCLCLLSPKPSVSCGAAGDLWLREAPTASLACR